MRYLILLFICSFLFGCATPSERFNQKAVDLGFKSQLVETDQFQHQIYLSKYINKSAVLHVYIDGDGTPWERNRWIADDPTARNPLILRLMKQDTESSILLGRPCYYGLSYTSMCDNKFWTSHRYSKQVVDSMVQALNNWLDQYDYKEIVIIGYSGGGAIALLMADKIKQLSTVVTVSANLDVTQWSEFHGYSPLKQSLNPADQAELNATIKQVHFAGKEDEIVPAFIIKEYAEKQSNAKYYEFPGKDHACCWDEDWGEQLRLLE